jgi:hypothetical protein
MHRLSTVSAQCLILYSAPKPVTMLYATSVGGQRIVASPVTHGSVS